MKAKTLYTEHGPMVSYDDFDMLQRSHDELLSAAELLKPFADEVVTRQQNENVFGYNGEMLTLTQLKAILSAIEKAKGL